MPPFFIIFTGSKYSGYHWGILVLNRERLPMKDSHKAKKKLKNIIWVCDKTNCRYTNTRTIEYRNVVNDDVCDKCKKHIHEPLTKTII